MIIANYFRNACIKKLKNITFLLFEINEHQCLNTLKL